MPLQSFPNPNIIVVALGGNFQMIFQRNAEMKELIYDVLCA